MKTRLMTEVRVVGSGTYIHTGDAREILFKTPSGQAIELRVNAAGRVEITSDGGPARYDLSLDAPSRADNKLRIN